LIKVKQYIRQEERNMTRKATGRTFLTKGRKYQDWGLQSLQPNSGTGK